MDSQDDKREMIRLAMHEMTDHTQTSIAIIVGIFGILLLFSEIEREAPTNTWILNFKGLMIVLSFMYWGLILYGLKSIIERQIFYALKENLIGDLYSTYNDVKLKEIKQKGGWTTKFALWRIQEHEPLKNSEEHEPLKNSGIFIIIYLLMFLFLWILI